MASPVNPPDTRFFNMLPYYRRDRARASGGFVNGRYAEIYIDGEITADNGLTYGAKIHFHTAVRSPIATEGGPGRQYVYLKGDWGSMEFGNWIGADSVMTLSPMGGGTVGIRKGVGGAFDTPYHSYVQKPKGALAPGHMSPYWFDTSPKATYYTPVLNGFQAGMSYTPSSKHRTDYSTHFDTRPNGATPENDSDWKDVIGLGAQWNGDFGSTSVGLSAVGGLSSDGRDDGKTVDATKTLKRAACEELEPLTPAQTETGMTTLVRWAPDRVTCRVDTYAPPMPSTRQGLGFYELAGKVGFGGFTVAGLYWDFGDGEAPAGAAQDWSGWGLSTSYTFGPYGIEVAYAHAGQSRTLASGKATSSDFDGMSLSLGYMIAPGLAWYGDVVRGTWDVAGTGEPKGDGEYSATVLLSGVMLNF